MALIALSPIALPASFVFFGWQVAETAVTEKTVEDEENSFETVAEDLFEEGRPNELAQLVDRRENTHPNDANVLTSSGTAAASPWNG